MQLRTPNPKLVIARITIVIVGIALFAYKIPTFKINFNNIAYFFLFAIALSLMNFIYVDVGKEGMARSSIAIILAAVFLETQGLALGIILFALIFSSFIYMFIKKETFLNTALLIGRKSIAIVISSIFLKYWLNTVPIPTKFAAQLIGYCMTALVFFLLLTALEALTTAIETHSTFKITYFAMIRVLAIIYFTFSAVSLLMSIMFNWMHFWSIFIFSLPLVVSAESFKLYVDIRKTYNSTIEALSSAIEAQDQKMVGHAKRVKNLSDLIGREMGFYASDLDRLNYAAILHDIGKLGFDLKARNEVISNSSFNTKLVPVHAQVGSEIIDEVEYLKDVSSFIKYHHYPYGNKNVKIPLEASIINVVDTFDHLTRSKKFTQLQAIKALEDDKGLVHHPKVVRIFKKILNRIQ